MKASQVIALTGLSVKDLPELLSGIGVDIKWQAVSSQHKKFMAGDEVDDLITLEQAEMLIGKLEKPETELEQSASRLFLSLVPLFKGEEREIAESFDSAPEAAVSSGSNWIDEMMGGDSGPVRYNRKELEGDDAGVFQYD